MADLTSVNPALYDPDVIDIVSGLNRLRRADRKYIANIENKLAITENKLAITENKLAATEAILAQLQSQQYNK